MLDERVLDVLARLEAEDAAEREAGFPPVSGHARWRRRPGGSCSRWPRARRDRGPGDRRLARVLVDLARGGSAGARRPSRLARARPGQVRAWRANIADAGLDDGRARRRRRSADAGGDPGYVRPRLPRRREGRLRDAVRARATAARAGGLVVADNVLSHAETLGAYSAARQADPTLSSVTVPLDRGLELSVVLVAT